MDALSVLLDRLKKDKGIPGHFLGLLHVLIGRRISSDEGVLVSPGLTWRQLAGWLKKVRWSPEVVRELGIEPDELSPRDRQHYWYQAIARAQVDSAQARAAGDKLAEILKAHGYEVGPAPGGRGG